MFYQDRFLVAVMGHKRKWLKVRRKSIEGTRAQRKGNLEESAKTPSNGAGADFEQLPGKFYLL